jgi:hypothetical protein
MSFPPQVDGTFPFSSGKWKNPADPVNPVK